MLNERTLSKAAGVTLLETMLALAIGAIILLGVVIYYVSTRQSANVTQVVSDMNAIVGAYKTYVGRGNALAVGMPMSALQDKGLLPKPFNDPWGQSYMATTCSPAGRIQISIAIPGIGPPDSDNTCHAIQMAVGNAAWPMTTSYDCMNNPGCGFVYKL